MGEATYDNLMREAGVAYGSGQPIEAASLYQQALELRPDDASALAGLGVSDLMAARYQRALPNLTRACELRPDDPDLLAQLSALKLRMGDEQGAMSVIDAALKADADHVIAITAKADLLRMHGRFDEAQTLINPRINAGDRAPALLNLYARLAPRFSNEPAAIKLLMEAIHEPNVPPIVRRGLLFRIADLLDQQQEYEGAWEAAQAANDLTPSRYSAEAHAAQIDHIISAWSSERLASAPRSTIKTELPIFIVGMPRSGTTLAEQILASHPHVFAGGERHEVQTAVHSLISGDLHQSLDALTSDRLTGAAQKHVALLRALDENAKRVTDKTPHNFIYLGLLSMTMPGVRVVHCVRDPLDTCLSCYFHSFSGAHPYADNLENLGKHYRDHDRIMAAWRETLDLRFFELRYEELVADQEAVTRRLIDFAGLEWSEQCLHFHEKVGFSSTSSADQIRKPISSAAVGRSRHYRKHLGPLRSALGFDEE